MAKFKGRSFLKQWEPMKRGIKLCITCDSETRYGFDINVYAGNENKNMEEMIVERIINKHCQGVRNPEVSL